MCSYDQLKSKQSGRIFSLTYPAPPHYCLVHFPLTFNSILQFLGAKRSNAATHAVLESTLEEKYDVQEAQKVRNHALIHYLASLANSNNNDDIFDFDFVQSLIENGADVNSTDRSGQTIFHEVARSWNSDVALFLLENGEHNMGICHHCCFYPSMLKINEF